MFRPFLPQVKDVAEGTIKEEDVVHQKTPAMKERETATDPGTAGSTTATPGARRGWSAAATTASSSAHTSTRRMTAVRGHFLNLNLNLK